MSFLSAGRLYLDWAYTILEAWRISFTALGVYFIFTFLCWFLYIRFKWCGTGLHIYFVYTTMSVFEGGKGLGSMGFFLLSLAQAAGVCCRARIWDEERTFCCHVY